MPCRPRDYVQDLADRHGLPRKAVSPCASLQCPLLALGLLHPAGSLGELVQAMAMLASPLAMQFQRQAVQEAAAKPEWQATLESWKDKFEERRTWFMDHAQPHMNLIPPVGVETMSYGRLMQLLQAKQVRRIQVLGDGTAAIVDVRPLYCSLLQPTCCMSSFSPARCLERAISTRLQGSSSGMYDHEPSRRKTGGCSATVVTLQVAMEGWAMDPTAGIFLDRHDNRSA